MGGLMCLRLVQPLPETRRDYAARLIRSWQLAVYGGHTLDESTVAELCGHFSTALDPPPAADGLRAAEQGA